MKTRGSELFLLSAAVAAALTITACGGPGGGEEVPREEKPVAVKVLAVTPAAVRDRLELPGRIDPYRTVTLSAEVGGLLEGRAVREGDPVRRGTVLATIDRENLELRRRHAALAVEQAAIAVRSAEIAVEQARNGIDQARAAADRARSALAQAEEQARKTAAVQEEMERSLGRQKALFKEQLTSQSRLDEIEMAFATASADRSSAEAGVEAATAGVTSSEAAIRGAESGLKAAIEGRERALSLAETAAANLDEAELYLRRSRITASLDGYVDRTYFEEGELVKAQDPVFRIVQVKPVKALFHLPEQDVPFLEVGQEAKVEVDTLSSEPIAGKVSQIGVTSDPATSTFRLEVDLPNKDGRLRPGMLARLRIVRREIADALTIPAFAAISEDGRTYVYLYREGAAVRRQVQTGIVDGDRVQITAGIEAGDEVIVKGQRDLEDGQKVLLP